MVVKICYHNYIYFVVFVSNWFYIIIILVFISLIKSLLDISLSIFVINCLIIFFAVVLSINHLFYLYFYKLFYIPLCFHSSHNNAILIFICTFQQLFTDKSIDFANFFKTKKMLSQASYFPWVITHQKNTSWLWEQILKSLFFAIFMLFFNNLLNWINYGFSAHIWLQNLWNIDRTIFVVIVF